MSQTISAIETLYNGYRFHSKRVSYCWTHCIQCRALGIAHHGVVQQTHNCVCKEDLSGGHAPRILASFAIANMIRFDDPRVKERLTAGWVKHVVCHVWTEGLGNLLAQPQAQIPFIEQAASLVEGFASGEDDE